MMFIGLTASARAVLSTNAVNNSLTLSAAVPVAVEPMGLAAPVGVVELVDPVELAELLLPPRASPDDELPEYA